MFKKIFTLLMALHFGCQGLVGAAEKKKAPSEANYIAPLDQSNRIATGTYYWKLGWKFKEAKTGYDFIALQGEYLEKERNLKYECTQRKNRYACFYMGQLIETMYQYLQFENVPQYAGYGSYHYYLLACNGGDERGCSKFSDDYYGMREIVEICAPYGGLALVGEKGPEYIEEYEILINEKKDLQKAIKIACSMETIPAPAEIFGTIQYLDQKIQGKTEEPYDYCRFVTSGYGSGLCSEKKYQENMIQLLERRGILEKTLNPEAKKALSKLWDAAKQYYKDNGYYESSGCYGGTAQGSMVIDYMRESFDLLMVELEQPADLQVEVTQADFKGADQRLNQAYQKLLALALEQEKRNYDENLKTFDVCNNRMLRDAQRSWILYRDAYRDYYVKKWKGHATPEKLKLQIATDLTLRRAKEFEELITNLEG